MGKLPVTKGKGPGAGAVGASKSGLSPTLIGAVLVAVIGIGVFAFWGSSSAPAPSSTAATTPAAATPKMAVGDPPTAEIVAGTQAMAALGPHKQANLPPIPFQGYAPPRPPEVVTAAFQFAAEHPEVSSYIPCFCGCQQMGHRGNTDCFVKSRAANGDVLEWEEHGMECAVCIDVATRSRQMHASGASVAQIRAAVEKEFGPSFTTMTPTPKPPATPAH